MLDIKYIAEHTEEVKNALLKRMPAEELDLEGLVDRYMQYKTALHAFEENRAKQAKQEDQVAKMEKGSVEFKDELAKLKEAAVEVHRLEDDARRLEQEYQEHLHRLPNIPDENVQAGGKEANEVLREWGEEPHHEFEMKDHLAVAKGIGMLDFDRAAKMSGSQFPLYMGDGAMLEWSLINFYLATHTQDGYTAVIPPHLVNRQSAFTAGQLPKFEDDVYWTQDELCLIPTAETALVNVHRDEILSEKDLPKKYCSYTPCYRREAGSYRATDRGLMRVHQFDKVEMVQYTVPEDSDEAFEELLARAEGLVQSLNLRYRVVRLAAEDMSFGMARTYDVEVWLPFAKMWSEVSSVSNARDFQARRGNIRFRIEDGSTRFVHTLNASGLANSRLMVALLETYQQKDGSVIVPEVLRDFMKKDVIKTVE